MFKCRFLKDDVKSAFLETELPIETLMSCHLVCTPTVLFIGCYSRQHTVLLWKSLNNKHTVLSFSALLALANQSGYLSYLCEGHMTPSILAVKVVADRMSAGPIDVIKQIVDQMTFRCNLGTIFFSSGTICFRGVPIKKTVDFTIQIHGVGKFSSL